MKLITLLTITVFLAGCIGWQSADYHSKKTPGKTVLAQFSGGSGESTDDAVVIRGIAKQSEEMEAEYYYIIRKTG